MVRALARKISNRGWFVFALTALLSFATPQALAGTPVFQPVVIYSSGGQFPTQVVIGDVNGDGNPDLVVANSCGGLNNCSIGTVGVLLGNGDGTFQPPVTYDSGPGTYAVAVGDLNGDGRLDIVVVNALPSVKVSVLLGNGDGTFQPPVVYDGGSGQGLAIALADLNHDGRLDVVTANWGGSSIFGDSAVGVLLGNGDGTLQPVVTYDCSADCDAVTIADVSGDGNPDLLVGTQTTVSVLLGNGDGTFQPKVDYQTWITGDTPLGVGTVVVADVNADGKPDVIAANQGSGNSSPPGSQFATDGSVAVLLGNGDGTFRPAVNYDSGGFESFSTGVGDFDGDGKLDLVVTNYGTTPNPVSSVGLLRGNGDGTFQPAITFLSGGGFAASLAVADLNADGHSDVVVVNQFGSTVGVLLSGSAPSDTTPPSITLSASPNVLWPPTGKLVPVTISGTIIDTGSGVDRGSCVYSVKDEYGEVQPRGAIHLGAGGTYSFTVLLRASRRSSDRDGRQYTITVSAKDNAGNVATGAIVVTVLREQAQQPRR